MMILTVLSLHEGTQGLQKIVYRQMGGKTNTTSNHDEFEVNC